MFTIQRKNHKYKCVKLLDDDNLICNITLRVIYKSDIRHDKQ